jgi:hypothetical protein
VLLLPLWVPGSLQQVTGLPSWLALLLLATESRSLGRSTRVDRRHGQQAI